MCYNNPIKWLLSLGNTVAICDRWIPAINVKNKDGCILASDVSQIAYRTVRDYNRIARGSDKIW
ncbi:hypothetical protein GEV82_01645 [Salmonella enterica]|nr:hypothetical protein [Salmonella enterica]EDI9672131.1 hypothetical protein [Salmonella enterica]